MKKSRLTSYLVLIVSTVVCTFLLTYLFVFINDSRETGIGWGLSTGILVAHLLTLWFMKSHIAIVIIQTMLYCVAVFAILYINSRFFKLDIDGVWSIVLLIVSMIISFEISALVAGKINKLMVK